MNKYFLNLPRASVQSGATMIEVLVSILIFSVGLLGIATTQTMGLTTTQSAMHRSYAAQLSYELIDIVRSNPEEAENAFFSAISIDTDSTASFTATNACDTTASACTTTEMANMQMSAWETRLGNVLTGSRATLTSSDEVNFQLIIKWPDFRTNQDRIDASIDVDGDSVDDGDDAILFTDFRI
ncbi:type IV pilus modification protein PilV [Reinekea marinisedimentorum]|uniref:Type IV pilus assembly protein PilV n=1 Tax=Reinekea marinisedimentorum TaxID=230495 RepID=A0A4R3HTN6_9GAMM|nr:type IV pilus modification protein PilV [Reinekea marinisedimentorum]TCS36442.1 type IV pilus assembly protein PilV [Reinekea marinisedimentorum]